MYLSFGLRVTLYTKLYYCSVLHHDILVNDKSHVPQWVHKIMKELKNFYHLVTSVLSAML